MSPEQVDILILGSGQGGKLLAWHMGQAGKRTVVVERRWVGGSCPNIACMPSKNEIWGARIGHLARRAAHFGTLTGPVSTDMARVRQREREMVDREIAFHLDRYKATGVELVMGPGRFIAPKTIEVQMNDGATRVFAGSQVFPQPRLARGDSGYSRSRRCGSVDPHRGARARLPTVSSRHP